MPDIIIRPYQPTDRPALHRIAADTAFFGEPVEHFLDDRRIISDALFAYYTDQEPEHSWVACAGSEVVGFLTGCLDTRLQEEWQRRSVRSVTWRALTGQYRLGPKTWRCTKASIRALFQDKPLSPDLTTYPAHLHINVDAPWRGQGAGRRLLQAYFQQLKENHIVGVHLHTSSLNKIACRLYERVGFRLLAAQHTAFWSALTGGPVESRCYGRSI